MLEHSVIIHFQYENTDLTDLFELEDRLTKAIEAAGAGEFDGNEIADDGSDAFLFMYGPDADKLYSAIEKELKKTGFMRGAEV